MTVLFRLRQWQDPVVQERGCGILKGPAVHWAGFAAADLVVFVSTNWGSGLGSVGSEI